jgi:hypothetical protein
LTHRVEEANLPEPPADTAAQRIANIAMTSADLFPGVEPDKARQQRVEIAASRRRALFEKLKAKLTANKP